MNSLERAGQNLLAAHRRAPLAVMPGHVLSPMDTERTIGISRSLIDDCQRDVEVAAAPDLLQDPEFRRVAAGPTADAPTVPRAG